MRSSVFAKWATGHQFKSHVVLPVFMSLAIMALYFSGNVYLQNLVAPSMDSMPLYSSREFGVLEILQDVLLLFIIVYSVRCFLVSTNTWIRLVAISLLVVSVFTFLEEIDYGMHFVEYVTGEHGSLAQETWNRNWHNKLNAKGVQNVSYIKLAINIGVLVGFVLAPLLLSKVQNPTIRLLLPSKWMISTVFLIVLLSLLAHSLDRAGFATIDQKLGNLDYNISEFRELNMYYLLLLYVAILYERLTVKPTSTFRS